MSKWKNYLLLCLLVTLLGAGSCNFIKKPALAVIKSDGNQKWGKINVFEGLSDRANECDPDSIKLVLLSGENTNQAFKINCLFDGALVKDWKLVETYKNAGVEIPIFIASEDLTPFKKVVYGKSNEIFSSTLATNSKLLVNKFRQNFGEKILGTDIERAFTQVYENAEWGRNEKGEAYSGPGNLPENCEAFIDFFEDFLVKNSIQSVVEIGCGDWTLQRHLNWDGIDYTGISWVKFLTERNEKEFGSENIHFVHGDATQMELPPGDLLICKEVFQHISNDDISKILKKARQFKHCLFVEDFSEFSRLRDDTPPGGYLPLNLKGKPFDFEGEKLFSYKCGVEKVVYYLKRD